jgi:hypothetical protein
MNKEQERERPIMNEAEAWLIKDANGSYWNQIYFSERTCKKVEDDSNYFEINDDRKVKCVKVKISEVESE